VIIMNLIDEICAYYAMFGYVNLMIIKLLMLNLHA